MLDVVLKCIRDHIDGLKIPAIFVSKVLGRVVILVPGLLIEREVC